MDNFRAMEVVATFSSNPEAVKKLTVASFVESVIVDFLLATRRSIACFFVVAGVLLKNEDELLNLIGADHRFPMDELHRKERPGPENVDGSGTEDDDDEDDDADQDDDDGDEDFSGEDGGEDDEEGDPEEDPVANGNDGSEDDEDEDDEDGDGDEDGEDDEDEDDEDEDEEDAPPAKKRK